MEHVRAGRFGEGTSKIRHNPITDRFELFDPFDSLCAACVHPAPLSTLAFDSGCQRLVHLYDGGLVA